MIRKRVEEELEKDNILNQHKLERRFKGGIQPKGAIKDIPKPPPYIRPQFRQPEMNSTEINHAIKKLKNAENISDGYHTFNELYYHRTILFATIVNHHPIKAYKSWLHHDGTMYDNMFIVGMNMMEGQWSYHVDKKYWDLFKCKELEKFPEWDLHKPEDVERLLTLRNLENLRRSEF